MGRHNRVLTAAALATVIGALAPEAALAQQPGRRAPVLQTVRATLGGAITGTVSDERGGPLSGVMVSVIGATMAMDVTDAQGRFSLDRLPSGEYILAAHRQGFAAARRQVVRVGAGPLPACRLQLRRLDSVVATSGTTDSTTLASRPVLAAGFDLPQIGLPDGTTDKDGHPHTEAAWRIRHLPRSILKDSSTAVAVADGDEAEPPSGSLFMRAMDSAASVAASLFSDIPFTGEVNLLTTSAFAPGDLFAGGVVPRGVAYLSIGAPTPAGNWQVRAAMGEGDLSSWIVAGSFVSRRDSFHTYDLGLSYSTQEYRGDTALARAAVTDGSRNVGELYAIDRWTLSPGVSFEYGGRYAHYDYLRHPGLVSPRAGFTLEPMKGTKVTAVLTQRMIAPGAEEFLSPGPVGPWLPPERTFTPLQGEELRVERARSLDVLFEHEFKGTYVVGVRRFFQSVDDQLVTVFGMQVPQAPRSTGHYFVATAGGVETQGWGIRVATPPSRRVQASIDYSLARARWNTRPDVSRLGAWVPAAIRSQNEDIHDLTAQVHTNIPETATRVFLLYKVNSAFTRPDLSLSRAGLDGRFDVQVNQGLPFGVAGTEWEVLIGVRNLFRDPNDPASLYDELLVVRPPKRVVGGFLVRF